MLVAVKKEIMLRVKGNNLYLKINLVCILKGMGLNKHGFKNCQFWYNLIHIVNQEHEQGLKIKIFP